MNAVLTAKQAREVTHGRTPLVPLEYEKAVCALQACMTLNDAKYWSNKADALAAWAKIYRSDEAGRKARQLKLHAFRRMGVLATELRPPGKEPRGSGTHGGGTKPGPVSLLIESGLGLHQANCASAIAKMKERVFLKVVNQERPPSPSSLLPKFASGASDSWKSIASVYGGNSFLGFRAWCRNNPPKELARGLAADEVIKVRELAIEVSEWLDEFERNLSRMKS